MEYLNGVVERITFQNVENGFSVLKIKAKGFPELVTVVGNMAGVNIGAVIRLKGTWKTNSKYGRQFAASEYQESLPATIAGLEKYLGSGLIKGIGPVYAKRIVRHFKEDTLGVMEGSMNRLREVEGIGDKRLAMIKKAWQEQKEIKNVMVFLQGKGVSTTYGVKIFKTYGNDSIQVVQENPYRLADDIWGIGFKTADKIAGQMGFAKNSPQRCRSGLLYVLNQLANDGHCYATMDQLLTEGVEILEVDEELINQALMTLVQEKALIAEEGAIYLPPFYHSEVGTANLIKEIMAANSPLPQLTADQIENVLASMEQGRRFKYDQIQKEAIAACAQAKFMVLTGGPGTGKTTTTLGMLRFFQQLGAKVLLAAPTGRAAKRLKETTRREAKTIHRLLEYKPGQGYQKNEEHPLDCDVLIIDETSMVDLILMYNLLKAVTPETVVILVGDVDQLPSVGAGNVLKDIIASDVLPVIKLTRIFRQAQGSSIITNAHRINRGEFPYLKGGRKNDFFFIEAEEPVQVVETIRNLCVQRLPAYYQVHPIHDIQVLCPMHRGESGAANLNQVLQAALNPEKIFLEYAGADYRLGDKVMQIKNNYDKNVFNGDIGFISHIDTEERAVTINYDGSLVNYELTELDEVVLSYATTVHKSQGSEYQVVVAPFTTQHFMMLQRNLLYTCVTRAKKIFVLVGTKKAIAMAVKNNKITKRNTRLAERLVACGDDLICRKT